MAKANDYTAQLQQMLGAAQVDTKAIEQAFKAQAEYGEKLTQVALQAAEKSTEVSTAWAKGTIAKLSDAAKAKSEPAEYSTAMTDFGSAQAEMASEFAAAFAEIAKRVQMETVEIMMAAGKDATDTVTSAASKASKKK
jgi:hypothetical protein